MQPFEFELLTRVLFGQGTFERTGEIARKLGFRKTLIVSDPAIVETGLVDHARTLLKKQGIATAVFDGFGSNPDSDMVEAGRQFAAGESIDSLIGLGGGSSMDCAKGINFVLTNGGTMKDYWGQHKATKPMLPSIGIPTTAGTGSEAQITALISDSETHRKMACGDKKAAFRVAILDPRLTITQPRGVTAAAGYDAISHAVESYVTRVRTPISDVFARDAWRLLEAHYERVLDHPTDVEARGAMLLGAHEAGIAIEQSMLGATHACANPLTAKYGTTHAVAIGVMLPHVVRWNGEEVGERYADLLAASGRTSGAANAPELLAARLEQLRDAGGLPPRLSGIGALKDDFPWLSDNAATQWTGTFNPRPFDAGMAKLLYERAW
jgi:alcohol dehydrogenase class IV